MINPCRERGSNPHDSLESRDFKSNPAQSENVARSSDGSSLVASESLTESQDSAAPTCYSVLNVRPARRKRNWQIEDEWSRTRLHWKGRCAYCGKKPEVLYREHMMPVSRGGGDELENIVPACFRCNASKATKTPLEWFLTRLELRREPKRREGARDEYDPPHPAASWWPVPCENCGGHWVRPVIDRRYQHLPVFYMCCHCKQWEPVC